MEIAITRMSSKGQVVIPSEMRGDLKEGDKLILIRDEDKIIMRRTTKLNKIFEDDVRFAKKTEEAIRRYEKGDFKSIEADKFLKLLNKIKNGKNSKL